MSAARNVALVRARTSVAPKVAIVLGSGLGAFADKVEGGAAIPYADLEGFPRPSVSGHAGTMSLGRIGATDVAVLSGRGHHYEHGRSDIMRPALETLQALGVTTLVLTNAAGGLREEVVPGAVMMVTDHIGFACPNPLIGEASEARFTGMTEAYDGGLRRAAQGAADAEGVVLHQGVYMWLSGPSFETPAEIRAARLLGADSVGMSTVPEVIVGRFLGLKVLAFSVITNYAAGMTGAELSHQETKDVAPRGGATLTRILTRMLGAWPA